MTKKNLFALTIGMILFLVLFSYGVSLLTVPSIGQGVTLDSYVSSSVYRTDGTADYSESNYFGPVKKGDRLKIKIPLPLEEKISPSVIFFSVYQCEIRLSYKDTILYEYGDLQEDTNAAIGNVLVSATVPDEAWGDALTLECYVADYCDFSKLSDVIVCDAKNSLRYLVGRKIPAYLLSMTILIVFTAMFLTLVFWKQGGVIRKQGLYLSAFCVAIMLWQMGYDRMFYVWSDNVAICGMVEYIGIFYAPSPFCMFLYYVEENKLFRKAMVWLASASCVLFTISTILNFTTQNWHYSRILRLDHILIAIAIFVILLEFVLVRTKGDNKKLMIRFGVFLYLVSAISDLLTFYIDTTGRGKVSRAFLSTTSLGMYIFLLLMLASYVIHALEHVISIRDKERLEQMAYQDGLTKAPNRRSCLDFVDGLEGKDEYSVFFFDVNNLKLANDQYGHEKGDELIIAAADLIGSIFGQEGFYGRYGGDEFIAVVETVDKERMQEYEARLKEKLKELNDAQVFPFPVQISYGMAASTEGMDADEVVRIADKRMYEQKWLQKQKNKS